MLVTALVTACGSSDESPASLPGCPDGQVVRSAAELTEALSKAALGDTILIAPGRYAGTFVADSSGTAERPITLCGTAASVLDAGTTEQGYTLHLDGADHWRISGMTLRAGAKGLMLDGSSDNEISSVSIEDVGEEAVHLRTGSSRNVLQGLQISGAGLRTSDRGEGIYIGSAQSNWCKLTDCEPDRSDDNQLIDNRIEGTTAEAIDIKEGTSGGVLRGNRLDGRAATSVDSLVDVKGNGWTIAGTVGTAAPEVGAAVFEILPGWGKQNVFEDNRFEVPGSGWAIKVFGQARAGRNVVECSNVAAVDSVETPARVTPEGCTD